MKTGYANFLSRKMFAGIKAFWFMAILCTGCASSPAVIPVTGAEVKAGSVASVSVSPQEIDFGSRMIGLVSSAKTVTIRNEGAEPLLIKNISVTAGFSIAANSCPIQPEVVAVGETCTVEVTFEPNLPREWVGELQIAYAPGQIVTIPLKGYGEAERHLVQVARLGL